MGLPPVIPEPAGGGADITGVLFGLACTMALVAATWIQAHRWRRRDAAPIGDDEQHVTATQTRVRAGA